jgi:subtilisin family serine protease
VRVSLLPRGKELKLKILTVTLLILLLTNIISATFNVTSAYASAVNANSPKTDNTANDLLKNVDLNKTPQNTATSSNNEDKAVWNFEQNQTSTTPNSWSTNSTEIVVGLTNTWDAYAKIEQLALTKHAKITNKITIQGRTEAVVINTPHDSVNSLITEIKQNNWSTYIEPNTKYQADMTPNDPDWNLQWGPAKIQANYAWNTTTGSNNTLVCVIDTGIDYNHPDLAANYALGGYDWVNNDSNPMDDHGHGTHCAGIIGAVINNNIGIAGIAQVRIMAEKALDASGGGYEDDLANAIIDATNKGAKILSMSWGGGPSNLIHDALKYAYAHGVLLVAAAGNSGSSAKHYPAAYDEVIAVTATDSTDTPAYFTTYGDWVELAAPGVDIWSTVWDDSYRYMSGTSMACPHVSGTAALVWSEFPNMSRDVLRMHLRDTADDLGKPGFDIYYGYGRINARRAIEEPLPEHDIIISNWNRPPYIEPGQTGRINATLINYGRYDETGVTVELLVNGSTVQPTTVVNLTSGTSKDVSLPWTPMSNGNYNVTVNVMPVTNETNVANNIVQGYIYVGIPLKVFVLRSAGTQLTQSAWDTLNYNWKKFGNQLIYIDYTTLDKDNITYDDLNATGADVLILSCAYTWEYADAEIEAIKQYVYEGHGFIATAGTFYAYVPNNNKFAPMFGLNESLSGWGTTSTDLLDLLGPSHPLFVNVPNPYTMPSVGTSLPPDGTWSRNELDGGKYVAMGFYNESAIVVYRGLVFISPWLEALPEQYFFNFQILYNAITWSRYQKPERELAVSLKAPSFLFPNTIVELSATVKNEGLQNESNVKLQLSIYDTTHNELIFLRLDTIPLLYTDDSYSINFTWDHIVKGVYNITAYATPVPGEENLDNNKVAVLTTVAPPLIKPQEGQWANYIGYLIPTNASSSATMAQPALFGMQFNYSKYISPYQMNVTIFEIIYGTQGMNMSFFGWTIVNIGTRWCESGPIKNEWWLGMIETNITIGSIVNISGGQATVIGNETISFGTRLVDCWKLSQSDIGNYTWWYAKSNGLWIQADFTSGSVHERVILDGTNIPTGYTPEHELLVTLNAPSFISLGTSSILNAAVSNYGLKNETNIELILEIDGSIVDSLPIAKLVVNESRTFNHPWTPLVEGTYNVTAYVVPVPGESIKLDNKATAMVRVAAIRGHVLFDQTHVADTPSNYNTWINNLQNLGYIIDVHTTGSITSDVLAGYDAFITINAHASYSDQELEAIQEFVANGSGLLVVGDDFPSVYTGLTGFAGISWTYGGTSGFTTYINPHEVTQGVSTVYLLSPSAFLNQNGSSGQVLVRDYSFNIMLAVNWYQRGRVMGFADQDSLRDYGIGYVDNLRLATNMIVWLCEKDITPPQMIYIAPSNGTLIGNTTVTMHWLAVDLQSGINYYETRIDSGLWINKDTTTSHTFIGLSNGEHTIDVRVWDKAGNSANSHVTISVDLVLPTVEILTPANNSYARQTIPINVSGSDINFDRMEIYIDSSKVATFNSSGAYTYYWNTLSESYGTHRIILTGYDKVGHNASTTITVTIDNVQPIAVTTSPANNTFVRGSITITFVAQDLNLKNTSLMIGGTMITSQPFNTAALQDGNYTIKLVAYDLAGNEANSTVAITIDNTTPTAKITSPANSTFARLWIGINFTATDANLEKTTLSIDGQTFDVAGTTYYEWGTYNVNDGNHVLILTVQDKAGNTDTDKITIKVDHTAPVGGVTSPLDWGMQGYTKGLVDIKFYGYDTNLDNMQIYINSSPVSHVWNASGPYTYTWNTTGSPDGIYTIQLTIKDKAGNEFTTQTTIKTDNTPPTISIDSPQSGAALSGKTTIQFNVTDDSLPLSVVLYINNTRVAIYTFGHLSYDWDTTKFADGTYMIEVVASDDAANTNVSTMTVTVQNASPIYTYGGYVAVGVLGLVLGALVIWVMFKRKPASAPASTTTTT